MVNKIFRNVLSREYCVQFCKNIKSACDKDDAAPTLIIAMIIFLLCVVCIIGALVLAGFVIFGPVVMACLIIFAAVARIILAGINGK